jgi:flagellar motor switch protein FliG
MLNGKQKAQLLIKLLENKSSTVLQRLNPSIAKQLTSSLEDTADLDEQDMLEFLENTLNEINNARQTTHLQKDIAGPSNFDLEISSISETNNLKEKTNNYPSTYRSVEKIAQKLQEQQPQLIAFFLNKTNETLRKDILEQLPEDLKEKIKNTAVDAMPISSQIYDTIFNKIILKNDDDINEEANKKANEFNF